MNGFRKEIGDTFRPKKIRRFVVLKRSLLVACSVLGLCTNIGLAQNPLGFDTASPERARILVEDLELSATESGWMRVRDTGPGVTRSLDAPDAPISGEVRTRRAAMTAIRGRGIRMAAILEWPTRFWTHGIRPAPSELPIDLKEAYTRCRDLAFTYGDLIDAWEIENEPDIDFVRENAETYAAFYKACALGIIHGRAENRRILTQRRQVAEKELRPTDQQDIGKADGDDLQTLRPSDLKTETTSSLILEDLSLVTSAVASPTASAVMHGPLALPPGPYWDELVANETLKYTEAFNYHYYGYAEDFKGVRDWWIAALEEALQVGRFEGTGGKVGSAEGGDHNSVAKTLPSEAGTLSAQQARSHIHTPLEALRVGRFEGNGGKVSFAEGTGDDRSDLPTLISASSPSAPTGADLDHPKRSLPIFLTEYGYGLLDQHDRFTIEGRERQAEWFRQVTPFITDGTITGAMAFYMPPYYERGVNEFGLLANADESKSNLTQSREAAKVATPETDGQSPPSLASPGFTPSRLCVEEISPVVIDFIAGKDTQSVKRYNGHLLLRLAAAEGSSSKSQVAGPKQSHIENHASASEPGGTVRPSDSQPLDLRSEATSSGEFTLVLYNFSDEPVTGTLSVALDSGTVAVYAPPPPPPPPTKSQKSDDLKTLRPSDLKTGEAPRASPPPPYVRPDTPRSSLRPPTAPDWPNEDTRTITTENLKTYAITPALEFLLNAARSQSSGGTTSVSSATASPPHRLTAPPPDLKTFPPSHPHTGFASNPLTLSPMERREITFTATLPNDKFRGHRLWATWTSEEPPPGTPSSSSASSTETNQPSRSSALPEPSARSAVRRSLGEGGAAPPPDRLTDSPPHRFTASKDASRLATRLYPSPSAFRAQPLDSFTFSAVDNAEARATQLARPIATEEAALAPHPTAERWLSTPGVEIEESLTGWRITINDLPPESLRPAELELPLLEGWTFPSDAALSFKYRLILPPLGRPLADAPLTVSSAVSSAVASAKEEDSRPLDKDQVFNAATASNRFEELDVNFRDANGTLWSVWPRLFAKKETQNYLEPAANFTPMFFSRAPVLTALPPNRLPTTASPSHRLPTAELRSLVLMFRPRVLPTTIEINFPQMVRFAPR